MRRPERFVSRDGRASRWMDTLLHCRPASGPSGRWRWSLRPRPKHCTATGYLRRTSAEERATKARGRCTGWTKTKGVQTVKKRTSGPRRFRTDRGSEIWTKMSSSWPYGMSSSRTIRDSDRERRGIRNRAEARATTRRRLRRTQKTNPRSTARRVSRKRRTPRTSRVIKFAWRRKSRCCPYRTHWRIIYSSTETKCDPRETRTVCHPCCVRTRRVFQQPSKLVYTIVVRLTHRNKQHAWHTYDSWCEPVNR